MENCCLQVDGELVMRLEVWNFGSMVSLDGSASFAVAHSMAQATTCFGRWKAILMTPWIPIWKMLQATDWERAVRQLCKLERSNGGVSVKCANTASNGARPVVGSR